MKIATKVLASIATSNTTFVMKENANKTFTITARNRKQGRNAILTVNSKKEVDSLIPDLTRLSFKTIQRNHKTNTIKNCQSDTILAAVATQEIVERLGRKLGTHRNQILPLYISRLGGTTFLMHAGTPKCTALLSGRHFSQKELIAFNKMQIDLDKVAK